MNRAYSVLDVKGVREEGEFVYVEGIASTPKTDRMGDVVEPTGAKFKTPMPLLWQHRHDSPVGHVTFAKPTKAGIPFKAQLPRIKEAGALKDRVDEAIHSLQYRLVGAVSIGFAPVEGAIERIDSGLRFKEWEWLELSLVTIPANADAVITAIKALEQDAHLPDEILNSIKSIDTQQRAASGKSQRRVVRLTPGDSGTAEKRKSIKLIPR
jgi:HK97 family phage prohead protease